MKGPGDVFGLEVSHNELLDDSPGVAVKASQGLVYGWHIKNNDPTACYVQFFNAAAVGDVSLGTTTPKLSIGIEASGKAEASLAKPIIFDTGIVIFSTETSGGSTAAVCDADIFFA